MMMEQGRIEVMTGINCYDGDSNWLQAGSKR